MTPSMLALENAQRTREPTHQLGTAEQREGQASSAMTVQVKTVERRAEPQVDTGRPYQHCVLETVA